MLPPLVFVVVVSMVKDAYEDIIRHIEDDKENSAKTMRYNKEIDDFAEYHWSDVRVGDFVRIRENEFFPADLLLLTTSEGEGNAYVETKNLDGETNLKNKNAMSITNDEFLNGENLSNMRGIINCEHPNNRIYKFDGNFQLESGVARASELSNKQEKVSVSSNNVVLRGMSLRNTE